MAQEPLSATDWRLADDWRQEASARARRLYPNQGLHEIASFIAQLHPNAIDYLTQAPVIACSIGPRGTHSDNLYIASRIGGPIERGERLKSVMAAVGLVQPLRRIEAFALTPTAKAVIYQLARIPPSALAFAIPATPGKQRDWLSRLKTWNEAQAARTQVASLPFAWAAREISRHAPSAQEVRGVVDFLISNPGNEVWSWDKAFAEMQLWHDRLADEREITHICGGISATTVIDYSSLPATASVSGFEFVKLDTPGALITEGRRMRHCVASYVRDVVDGRCSIYSIRSEERRFATLEIDARTNSIRQLAGFANAKPKPFILQAARQFAREAAA
jgi:hypothetical protein